ncbi:MAG: 2-hydroxyacyl-CoA dehydratase [bacterium]
MSSVLYSCPFITPEWINAHNIKPIRFIPTTSDLNPPALSEGICPYVNNFLSHIKANRYSAVIVTTVCDQMRRASELIELEGDSSVFLFNVPSTWQEKTSMELYSYELRRLGNFLTQLGGSPPSNKKLSEIMDKYNKIRMKIRNSVDKLSSRMFAEKLVEFHRYGLETMLNDEPLIYNNKVPLALIGGPLPETDFYIFDIIEKSGGRVILNGTENGERTLPDQFNERQMCEDPFSELVRAYFGSIPDVSRRPHTTFYQWLRSEVEIRKVKGIIVRYYSWCDLWHGEVQRLREKKIRPVISISVGGNEPGTIEHIKTRIEAFVEQFL